MRTFNDNWIAANLEKPRRPRITIALSFDTGNTDIVYLTSHADANSPPQTYPEGASVITDVIRNFSDGSQSIDPLNGRSSIGRISFEVLDLDGQITSLLNDRLTGGDSLRLKRAIVYRGFAGLDWDDFEVWKTHVVHRIIQRKNSYLFHLDDIQRAEKKEIFTPHTATLSKTVKSNQTHIPITVSDLTLFPTVAHDDSYSDRPSLTVGYARIDHQNGFEIIAHTGIFTHATDGTSLRVATNGRGSLNTAAVDHEVDLTKPADRRPKVEEFIYLEGPALKILFAIQTGTLYGQGSPEATLPAHWHLGISEDFIDITEYESVGPDVWNPSANTGRMLRFLGMNKTTGKDFIEKEILSWLVAFQPVKPNGALGFRRVDPILSDGSYVGVLTDNEITSVSDLEYDYDDVVNRIRVVWNWNQVREIFTKANTLIDLDSLGIFGRTEIKEFQLRGVHTSQHTDKDLEEYFNTWRDRFSGAPLKIRVDTLSSVNQYEVGDTVLVNTNTVRDPVAGTTSINRVFEVQSVRENPINAGGMSYSLFASTRKAGEISNSEANAVLDDAAYVNGTELSTVLTIVNGVITTNGNLPEGNYHFLGNLELASGVTVTFNGHVNLWVRGFLDINGSFDGAGRGLSGTTRSAMVGVTPKIGNVGFIGKTKSQGGLIDVLDKGQPPGVEAIANRNSTSTGSGAVTSLPYFTIKNNSSSLEGLPETLLGTSGGPGLDTVLSTGGVTSTANASDGANGGASMTIISRGGDFGVGGEIDTSGDDAGIPDFITINDIKYYGGAGAGGYAGGVLWLLDGNQTAPDLSFHHKATTGNSPHQGEPTGNSFQSVSGEAEKSSIYIGNASREVPVSTSSIQYIPSLETATEETDPLPSDVTNFIAKQIGVAVNFSWSRILDADRAGYTIKFGPVGVLWEAANFLTEETRGTRITNAHVPVGEWDFLIKAKDYDGNESVNAARYTLEVTTEFDLIDERTHEPSWAGATLENMGIHYSGKLYPKSQGSASDDGWDTFDVYVPQPYDDYSVSLDEQDVNIDELVRTWIDYSGDVGPGETGTLSLLVEIDYRTSSGSYDGYENWVLGEVLARFVKYRITMLQVDGLSLGYIGHVKTTVDTLERYEEFKDATIAMGGTTLTFSRPFHFPPGVTVTVKGSSPRIATYDNLTNESCDIFLFNTAGSDVGGTATVRFDGV